MPAPHDFDSLSGSLVRFRVDSDEGRRIEKLLEALRRETERLKRQVEATRDLHRQSRQRFLENEAIFKRRRHDALPPALDSDPHE